LQDSYLSQDLEDRWEDIDGHPHWITPERTLRIIGKHVPITGGAPVYDTYLILQLLSPNGWQPLHQLEFRRMGNPTPGADTCIDRLKQYAERLFLRS
jgi:hypothetical protein